MYTVDGITYTSPFEHWGLEKKDLKNVREAVYKNFDYYCPVCGEKLLWDEGEYEVDGKTYPQYYNEYLSSTPDGTIHDWDEVHCCKKCKAESWFDDGCF